METGNDKPQAFDVILFLLLGGRSVVTGNEPVAFASEISYPDEDQNDGKGNDPEHTETELCNLCKMVKITIESGKLNKVPF